MYRKVPSLMFIASAILLSFLVSCEMLSTDSAEFPTGRFVLEEKGWAIQYYEDGTWAFFAGDMEVPADGGTYRVDGDLVTDEGADGEEGHCAGPATYRWSFDGQMLSFELEGDDQCANRRVAFDGRSWTFVGEE